MSDENVESTQNPRPARANRLPGLEWLRAGLTLAVVLLHAGMAYLTRPFPGLVWSTHDQPSVLADWVCWGVNAVVMPGFFILGGYGAAGLLKKLGPEEMAKHRLRRLGGPFLLGCVLILPLALYVWLLGWAADGIVPLKKLKSLKFDNGVDDGLWGVAHLWFLQYLLLFCLGYAAWRRFVPEASPRSLMRLNAFPAMCCLMLVSMASLAIDPQIVIGFRHSWYPLPAHIGYYLPMFVFGTIWAGGKSDAYGRPHVAGGALIWLASTPLRSAWLDQSVIDGPSRIVVAGCYAASGWLMTVGMFGIALRTSRPLTKPVAYFALASFWVYFLHHPVVGLSQVGLKPFAIDPTIKFVLTTLVGVGVSLGTFELFVRRSWIGRVLGVPSTRVGSVKKAAAETDADSTNGFQRAA